MIQATQAFHCGGYSKVCIPHNIRDEIFCKKEKHIDPNGYHSVLEHKDMAEAYDEIFTQAIQSYNVGKKPSRQTYGKNGREYLEILTKNHIEEELKNEKIREENKRLPNGTKRKKESHKWPSPVREVIVGIYPTEAGQLSKEKHEEIAKEFLEKFKEKNPNIYVVGAYFHADEEGGPHMHIDYIPLAYQNQSGLSVQPVESRCLQEMGYEKVEKAYDPTTKSFDLPKVRFENEMRAELEKIAENHGIEILHPKEKREHLEKEDFIAHQELDQTTKKIAQSNDELDQVKKDLSKVQEELEKKNDELDQIKGAYETVKIAKEELEEENTSLQASNSQLRKDNLSLRGEKSGLESQILGFKAIIRSWVDKFHELKPKALKKRFEDIYKQRKLDAAVSSCEKTEPTIQEYLDNDDLQSEIPVDAFGRFQRGVDKMEELLEPDEEWERD